MTLLSSEEDGNNDSSDDEVNINAVFSEQMQKKRPQSNIPPTPKFVSGSAKVPPIQRVQSKKDLVQDEEEKGDESSKSAMPSVAGMLSGLLAGSDA